MSLLTQSLLDWQTTLPKASTLDKNALHLWLLPLQLSFEKQEQTLALLNRQQQEKYHRLSKTQARQTYLAGRYYLLRLLSNYTQQNIAQIALQYNRHGKPALSSDSNVQFNYSDTCVQNQTLAVMAVCRSAAIGVDIEWQHRRHNATRLSEKYFTADERQYIGLVSNATQSTKSLAIWTRKEALGKAIGVGIHYPMNSTQVIGENDSESAVVLCQQKEWKIHSVLRDDYIVSVAYENTADMSISAFHGVDF